MSRIELAPEVGDDLDRILDYLAEYQVENPVMRIREIIEALNVLEHNPLIGRPANNDKRELVIGRRSHGHVALYRYVAEVDTVFILAVRSQREVGFAGGVIRGCIRIRRCDAVLGCVMSNLR